MRVTGEIDGGRVKAGFPCGLMEGFEGGGTGDAAGNGRRQSRGARLTCGRR
jgi:hypothetical protein